MIQVLNRAFDILEYIAQNTAKIYTLSEIADHLKLNHATCANIIKTMVQRNYIEQIGHKKGYRLGFMTYQLNGESFYEKELIAAAKEEMKNLTQKLNETSLLGIRKKNIRVSLYQEMSDNDLMVKSKVEKHLYSSASGRMLLAMMAETDRDAFVAEYGLPSKEQWENASSLRKFNEAIRRIQDMGYATQISEVHIAGIAVPLYRKQEPIASLSIFLPEPRLNPAKEKEIVNALLYSAKVISKKLVGEK
ncbi:transcriptional regulator, IclR family [bacterium A37T11]|nr:transcriptional regulator, IclR family [bacterium A37T11]